MQFTSGAREVFFDWAEALNAQQSSALGTSEVLRRQCLLDDAVVVVTATEYSSSLGAKGMEELGSTSQRTSLVNKSFIDSSITNLIKQFSYVSIATKMAF